MRGYEHLPAEQADRLIEEKHVALARAKKAEAERDALRAVVRAAQALRSAEDDYHQCHAAQEEEKAQNIDIARSALWAALDAAGGE